MPLWLDLLRTPMAAPETRRLRRMRRTWQALCVALAAILLAYEPLTRLAGRALPCAIAALLVAATAYGGLYFARKRRADEAWLDQLGKEP
jgi:L-lactate permease